MMKRALLIALVLLVMIPSGCVREDGSSGLVRVYFPDMREAILIETPEDRHVLIDAGEGDEILGYLRKKGVDRIDVAVLTHPHGDHYRGFVHMIESGDIEIGTLYHNNDPGDVPVDPVIAEYMEKNPEKVLKAGDSFEVDGVSFEVMWPETSDPEVLEGRNSNDNSIVMMASYGRIDILLTGDCAAGCVEGLMDSEYDLRADVLKLGHHGDPQSSPQEFLDAVSPGMLWLSFAGPVPVDRYLETGEFFSTFSSGETVIITDGNAYNVRVEKRDEERLHMLNGTVYFTVGGDRYSGSFNRLVLGACEWMKENTPESARFLNWWDYGPSIIGYGERDSVIYAPSREILDTISRYAGMSEEELESIECPGCMGHSVVRDVAVALTSENASETAEIMEKHGAEYLLVTSGDTHFASTVFSAAGRDVSRYFDMGTLEPLEEAKDTVMFRVIEGEETKGFTEVYSDGSAKILKTED